MPKFYALISAREVKKAKETKKDIAQTIGIGIAVKELGDDDVDRLVVQRP